MRDIDNGYILRYTHANVASFFFIFIYAHIGRGLWYGSYRSPRVLVWSIGVIILVLMIAVGFLGYVYSPKWFNLITNNILTTVLTSPTVEPLNLTICFFAFSFPQNKRAKVPGKGASFGVLQGLLLGTSRGNSQRLTVPPLLAQLTTGGVTTPSLHISAKNYTTLLNGAPKTETNAQNLTKIISNRLTEFLIDRELNPVFSYEDLQLDEVRKKILFETRNLSGVYMLLNKVTLDFYIGSASTGKFYSRFYRHLISYNGSKIVKFAVKKYKLTSFAFLILELFPEIVTKENNNKLITMEDFYLKTMLPNYNILTEAGSSFGYKHTEITRLNMSKFYSWARKERIENLNKGKTLSPETIEKMREKALNRKPLTYSAEAKANMKKNSKPIILYNLDRTVYGEFPSLSEAAKTIGCGVKTISRALKTEKKILKKRFIVC